MLMRVIRQHKLQTRLFSPVRNAAASQRNVSVATATQVAPGSGTSPVAANATGRPEAALITRNLATSGEQQTSPGAAHTAVGIALHRCSTGGVSAPTSC